MGIFFVYILKSSFSLALFYLFYRLLLNHDTFHRFNRIMLLALIAISALLPLISTTIEHPTQINHSFMTLEDMLIMQSIVVVSSDSVVNRPHFTWYEIIVMVYWIGVIFFMLRNVWSIFRIVQLIKSGRTVEDKDGVKVIVHSKKIPPFSWLKYILISEKDFNENCADILIHEKAHISRHHSYDIIFADMSIFIQWFNPAAWLLKQELKNIHEYEADDMVLKSGVDAKEYQLLLIEKAVGPKLYSIANNFNHSSLKKRITMMLKKKSNPWARMKYIYVLPVAAIAVTAFARPEVNDELSRLSEVEISEVSSTIKESIALPEKENRVELNINTEEKVTKSMSDDDNSRKITITVVDDNSEPIPGASVIIEGTNNGTLTDNKGKFTIQVNIGDVLCISYIGKSTLRVPIKKSMTLLRGKISLMMFDDVKRVDDVIVMGYSEGKGTQAEKKDEAKDDGVIFAVVEDMPEFPGGMRKCLEFLAKNIKYPVKAQEAGKEGRVIVQFVVDKDGSIKDPFVVRPVSPELDAEAVRVTRMMPKWKPGKQRNVNVAVRYTIPVTFKLSPNEDKAEEPTLRGLTIRYNSDGTLDESKNPLILADGKEISYEAMKKIDSKTIESISVNKDAQMTAKYGSKAKNGVVLITTKK